MFRPNISICVLCNKNTLIVVKAGLCKRCNEQQKNNKKKKLGKFKPYKYIRKKTNEAEIFEKIAEEREWVCFVTGKPLPFLTPTNFLHVLPKALNKYPKFKNYKENIVLGTDEVHFRWDKAPRSSLTEPYWKKMFELEAELKKFYKEIKNVPYWE